MTPAVLVPRRADLGRRDDLWAHVGSWWAGLGWPIVEGHDPGPGPFSIAAARNRAAAEIPGADPLILIDADTLPAGPEQVRHAVDVAARTGRMTVGHDRWRAVSRYGSDRILSGWAGNWSPTVTRELEFSWSSLVVVPRALWVELGGFDERFVGYGFEDTAFAIAAKALGGGIERVHGDVFHLWHPRSETKGATHPTFRANLELRRRYSRADGDPAAVRRILAERAA